MTQNEWQPIRVQLRRTKGWRMPPNTKSVTRPGRFGNPFFVGGYHKIGGGSGGFAYLTCCHPEYADASFRHVYNNEQAVGMFREYRAKYPLPQCDALALRGKNLACWCPLDQPCHADVLLELANPPPESKP